MTPLENSYEAKVVESIYEHAPAGIAGHQFAMLIVVYGLSYFVPASAAWTLVAMHTSVLLGRTLLVSSYRKPHKRNNYSPRQWLNWYQIGAIATGLLWGMTLPVLQLFYPGDYIALAACSAFAVAGAGIFTLGVSTRIYVPFSLALLVPIMVWLVYAGGTPNLVLAVVTAIYIGFLLNATRDHSQHFVSTHAHLDKVQDALLETINRLGMAAEFRDQETGQHITRIGESAYLLAKSIDLDDSHCREIRQASPMHDIGKIGIPDAILLKRGKLDENEWRVMQTHTTIGEKLLDGHDSGIMRTASIIAGTHHERWDGIGYPNGLSGTDIPIEGRITAICDVYDALTSERPYKEVWSHEAAMEYIQENAASHFDPTLVKRFVAISKSIKELRNYGNVSPIRATP